MTHSPGLPIPTESDWSGLRDDLDGPYALKMFFGKSREQAALVFDDVVIERAAELQTMPAIPFRYYLLAFKDYVLSERALASDWRSSAASCFLGAIRIRLETAPDDIRSIMVELLPAATYIAEHQLRYDADFDIFGSFQKQLNRIVRLANRKTRPPRRARPIARRRKERGRADPA